MDYCRFGHGKEILVILPGLSVQRVLGSAETIARAYRPMTEDFTVYVLERRNELPSSYSILEMAQDSAEVIKVLNHGAPVCIFGASQGGMLAMEIAIEHPELVRRMVIGSSSARVSAATYGFWEEMIRMAKDGDAERLLLAFGKALYPQPVFEMSRELLLNTAKAVTKEDLSRFVILTEGIQGFDILDDLKRVECPALVIGSRDDRALGGDASVRIAEQWQDRPDCELYLYDGYGHAAYDLAPDYKDRMRRFLLKK